MKHAVTLKEMWNAARTTRSAKRFVKEFARDEDGAFIIFSLFMFVLMLLTAGMALDLMRYETHRARLQGTLDRAVLAAADLDQTLSPEAVVTDYFTKAGLSSFLASKTVDQGLNYKIVSAQGNITMPTTFMRLSGQTELAIRGAATAEERVSNVEISLVVDISGSMGRNNKLSTLRTASHTFIDTVIRPETEDLISLNIIPYTAQVNAGPDIFDQLTVDQKHNFSHCIDFELADFNTAALDVPPVSTRTYEQMQHFQYGWSSSYVNNPGCPMQSYERIVPFSQDATSLKSTVTSLQARANTAIHLGMKWGVSMLDPTFRPIVTAMIANNKVDPEFAGRPVAYNDPETLKTIVLMTDGQNVDTYRISDEFYSTPSQIAHWDRYQLFFFTNNYIDRDIDQNYYYKKFTATQADTMLQSICDAAKAEGILVWTIGFEVSNHAAGEMLDCASSPSHFFRVEGVELSEAFASIARQINQLRLVL